jgi:flagellar basal-body rod modification protein FlgD
MAALAGILNHQMTAGQALAGPSASPMATGSASDSGSTGSSSTSSAAISANDFLTLLVTEMQNQDPTADTDPNEYINQLVQVNSLEQLIDINQTLTTSLGTPAASSGGTASGQSASAGDGAAGLTSPQSATSQGQAVANKTSALTAAQSATSGLMQNAASAQGLPVKRAPGNLSVPGTNPSANHVGHALDGRSHAKRGTGAFPGA